MSNPNDKPTWYDLNQLERLDYQHEYNKKNREQILQYQREYYIRNKSKIAQKRRRYWYDRIKLSRLKQNK